MNEFAELEHRLLGQVFNEQDNSDKIEEHKKVAKIYATCENSIAVLSDLKANKSYIYNGAVAKTLGLNKNGCEDEIESIWEDEIYARIHPDDLISRHILELHFFNLLRKNTLEDRLNLRTHSVIIMKLDRNSVV